MYPRSTFNAKIVTDPTLRFTTSGKAVASCRLLMKDRKKGANGEWEDSDPLWFGLTVWEPLAENFVETFTKGEDIIVAGRIQPRTWTGNDGAERTEMEMVADDIGASIRWHPWKSLEPVDPHAAPRNLSRPEPTSPWQPDDSPPPF